MLEQRYRKTEAGRAEIRARSLVELSRSGRNLLLVIDGSRSAAEWLSMVQGSTAGDVQLLLAHGLIALQTGAAAAPPAAAAAPPAAAPVPAAAPASPLGYAELYSYLTGHARQYLGLIKGYRMVLDVERCTDLTALQELAERFAIEVEKDKGADVAREVRQALGLRL
ncbi:hypothetical protein [Pelomonas sp. KK5]|uniref:hypothetical protein n=1 Tax=Pelomonas sp. KK5 TaxID=1855730 RepID=UPI00097C3975|nr:hypothetical protein [Pelomonas sp. KK5]